MSPPRPFSPSPSPRLTTPSSPPQPVCHETSLSSLVTPGQPPAVDAQLSPRISGILAVPTPCTPTASMSSFLPPTSLLSLSSPLPPQSHKPAAQLQALGFRPGPSASMLRSSSSHHGSASADRYQSSVRPFSQDSALDPPTVSTTYLPQAHISVTASTPFTEASSLFSRLELFLSRRLLEGRIMSQNDVVFSRFCHVCMSLLVSMDSDSSSSCSCLVYSFTVCIYTLCSVQSFAGYCFIYGKFFFLINNCNHFFLALFHMF